MVGETIIVPVHAEEAVGRNMIPLATSAVIAKKLGLEVDTNIVQAIKVSELAVMGGID